MDIWNELYKNMACPIGPCGIGSTFSVFELNREIEYKKSEYLSDFIWELYNKYDLAHLYALNRACFEVIESSVNVFAIGLGDEDEIAEIVESELECFDDIELILSKKQLIHEVWAVCEGEYWTNGFIETPKNMETLGKLSLEIQKVIENGEWEFPEMTNAYMRSLTIGNFKRFDYESFIYQLSQGYDCEDTINNFIPYLQKEASSRESLYAIRHWYEAELLRLIQWAEIGNVNVQVKGFCESIKINHPLPIDETFDESVWTYLNTPFALLRSDFALIYLKERLTKYLHSCQLWLQQSLPVEIDLDSPLPHLAKTAISAVYLFGAYRLDVHQFDESVLQMADDYLQCNQMTDAAFISKNFYFINHLELNAMAVHALWISEAHGWKRSIERVFDWIIDELDIYGVWYHFRYEGIGYTTGLMLDTISLIEQDGNVSFRIPPHKKKQVESKVEGEQINHEQKRIINNHIGNLFIYNDQSIANRATFINTTTNTDKKVSKTRPKKQEDVNVTHEKVKTPEEIKTYDHFNKEMKKICFVVKDDENISLFIDEKLELFRMPRVKLAPKLLNYLAGQEKQAIPANMVKGVSGSEDDPKKAIKTINLSIVRRLRKFHPFVDLPRTFEVIHNDNDPILYESRINVVRIEAFERAKSRPEPQERQDWRSLLSKEELADYDK